MSIVPIGAGVPMPGMTGISSIHAGVGGPGGIDGAGNVGSTGGIGETNGKQFEKLVTNLMGDVNVQQQQADKSVAGLVQGETNNVHDVMLSVAKADLSFRLMLEVRNRLLDSYQEIMRMQV